MTWHDMYYGPQGLPPKYGATTPLGRSYRKMVPERGGGIKGSTGWHRLAAKTSYKESERVIILRYILYYQNKEKKMQKDKQNKVK